MTKGNIALPWWGDAIMRDNTSSRIGVHAGYGASKSTTSWQIMLQRMMACPNVKYFCWTEPVYKLIKTIAVPKFKFIADDCYGLKEGRDYKISLGDTFYIDLLPTKQRIFLFSCEKPENIVGFDTNFIVQDEAGLCKKEARQRMGSRLRDNRGFYKPQLLQVGTPEGITDFAEVYDESKYEWVENQTFKGRDYTRQEYESRTGISIQYRTMRVTTFDNPYMDAEYIAGIFSDYGFNENYIRSYVYGFFTPFAEGLACPSYNPKLHDLPERKEADPYRDLHLMFDFNANPISWITAQMHPMEIAYQEFEDRYVIHDESELNYGMIPDSMIEFCVKYPVDRYQHTKIIVDGDRSGYQTSHLSRFNSYETIKDELTKLGYKNVHINASRKVIMESDSIEAINKFFYENKGYLNPALKQLKQSLQSVTLKPNERKLLKTSKDTITHKFDAIKYWVFNHIYSNNSKGIKGFNH